MLKFWKDNGCENVLYGIVWERYYVKSYGKKITREQNIKALKASYDAGLPTVVQLVIGMPGETDKTIDETIDFYEGCHEILSR